MFSQNINEEVNNLHINFQKTVYVDFQKAYGYAEESVKKSIIINNKELLLISYTNMSQICFLQKKLKNSIFFIYKALNLAENLKNYDILASLYLRLGTFLSNDDDLIQAIVFYEKALLISKNNNLKIRECDVYNNLAKLYRKKNNNEKAIQTFIKSVDLSKKINYKKSLVNAYNGLGNLFLTKNKDSSNTYYKKALKISRVINNKYLEGILLFNLGDLYLTNNEYKKALEYLNKSEKVVYEVKNYYVLHFINISKGIYYVKTHNYKKAIEKYEIAINKYGKFINSHQLMHSYWVISGVYEHNSNYKKAYIYQEKHLELKDSLMNIERTKEFEKLRTEYDVAKKDNQITLLSKEKQLAKNKRKTIIITATLLVSILLLLSYFLKNKINIQKIVRVKELKLFEQEIETKKALSLIEGQENERNRLSKELHDGLGGQLSGIKSIIQTIDINNLQEKTSLVDKHLAYSIKNLRNISHDLSAVFLKEKEFDILLQQLIVEAFNNKNIKTEISIFPAQKINKLSERYKLNIFRILQESFQNILKHAKATYVSVALILDEEITVLIEDNGIGFTTDQKANGIGLQNIKDRIQSLNGTLHIDSQLKKGTTLNLNIPYNDYRNSNS